ncbi:NAD-dependent succinate-semialdehyde dehydrogenase [Vineibacter terrae]|uniref:NAD-dependent succinate-semialdehyde dehydrogenase n=1 Tax=Vineibacter terrae TaxID=2586908 RepID=UPI0039C91E00
MVAAVTHAAPHPTDSHPALARLSDLSLLRARSYVDGQWTGGANNDVITVVDPATGSPVARVAAGGVHDVDRAIAAAVRAQADWAALLPQARAARLRDWHAHIVTAAEDLALIITLEQGKPLAEARGEIAYAASFVEWFAEESRRVGAEAVASHLPGAEMMVRREPLGVVGLVTPWNFPSAMLTRKAAAALAAGCTVVAHPSAHTPLSALALTELAARAGFPAGVFNVVPGPSEAIVNRLCDDARVRGLSFTGSTAIGRLIAARCAPTMKRLVMELGGHAPLIVFADADLERAVDIAIDAKFATSGQDCLAANRIYVERPLYAAFCAAFATRVARLKVGAGLDRGSEIGPLMHGRAVAKIDQHVRDAVARGARCLAGGTGSPLGPLFYAPTVLADVPDDALIMREETFGPVAALAPFDSEDEVVARANASEYGLAAYVVTRNGGRGLRLSRRLEYGMIAVNRVRITGAPIPFGGVKQSGLGREGARCGLEAFTDLKYVCLDTE